MAKRRTAKKKKPAKKTEETFIKSPWGWNKRRKPEPEDDLSNVTLIVNQKDLKFIRNNGFISPLGDDVLKAKNVLVRCGWAYEEGGLRPWTGLMQARERLLKERDG